MGGFRPLAGRPLKSALWEEFSRFLKGPERWPGAQALGVPYSKGDGAYRAAHSCLWDWELARRRALGSRAASPVGFGAFALLDGPGLTQFRVGGSGGLSK